MAESAYDQREQAARTAEAQLVAAARRAEGGRGREGADRGPAPRARLAARPHRGGGAGRRHRQPPHGPRRRLRRGRRRAHVPHRRQGRGRARRRGHRDAHGRRQGRPARARRGRRRRRDRRHRAAGLARGRQGDAPRPRAHLPRRQPGPAGRRLRPRHHRDRQPATASPCRPPPSSTAPRGPRCRWCATTASRRAGSRPGSPPARWPRCARACSEGELVVARSGTFLRDGDAVRPLPDKAARSARRSDELEHLGLVDPPAGAVAGAVHGADRARLRQLRPAARHALSQHRRADRAGARLPVGRGALRARGAGHQEDRGRHCRRQRRQAPDLGRHRGLVGDDHRVPPRGQPGPRAQRRQGRHRPHPRRAAAHHRRADRDAHRDRGPADRHLLGARAGHDAGGALLVRRRHGRARAAGRQGRVADRALRRRGARDPHRARSRTGCWPSASPPATSTGSCGPPTSTWPAGAARSAGASRRSARSPASSRWRTSPPP